MSSVRIPLGVIPPLLSPHLSQRTLVDVLVKFNFLSYVAVMHQQLGSVVVVWGGGGASAVFTSDNSI